MTQTRSLVSRSIGRIEYRLVQGAGRGPLPIVYLLHGRGDSASAWEPVEDELRRLPIIAVMPDAPWRSRAGYYIDSTFGTPRAVETAFTQDLIRDVESRFDLAPTRDSRFVAGYSMGGYGALRFALAHPDLFSAAIVMSPAVYVPEPPEVSSAREFGAFGRGDEQYDSDRYRDLNYPRLLRSFPTDRPLELRVAVGDAEPEHPGADPSLSMLAQAQALATHASGHPSIAAELRVYPGGHDFGVWRPALLDALEELTSPRSP